MKNAFLFPGQGSQTVGMGQDLYRHVPEARRIFDEVDDALAEPFSSLVFEGPEDRLRLTANAQPALMATSLAVLRALEARTGTPLQELCAFVAGHSLGEYSALAAAGALDVGTAARLLRLRGQAMQAAVPVGEGAMAAIIGLDLGDVEEIAQAASAEGICDVANDNSPNQVVISGTAAAVAAALELARGRGARRSMALAVSAPFHCRLMAPAAEAVAAALDEIELRQPCVPVVTNVSAAPEVDPAKLKAGLVEQVTARVRWRESLAAMAALGVERFTEVGPGKVLSALAKRTVARAGVAALGSVDDIEGHVGRLAA
jgi:[acyl-carrier-protein] S-malonyltransferase